jgi:hypothetical protein
MAQEPFLLDPRYHGTLDNESFRRRYREVNEARWYVGCLWFLIPVVLSITSLIFWLLGRLRGDPDHFETAAWLCLIPGAAFLLLAVAFVLRQRDRAFHRRMARDGTRLDGTIVTCLRKLYQYGEDESSEYLLEVVYKARTPSGVDIRGVKALKRDDFLNSPLPPPGHPVVVLVLDDRWHTVL